jgi:hypothetical protein
MYILFTDSAIRYKLPYWETIYYAIDLISNGDILVFGDRFYLLHYQHSLAGILPSDLFFK